MATAPGYDVIVVGGGPAGCVLADRLSEDPSRSILLVEAGPDYGANKEDWPSELLDPFGIAPDSHPWGYQHVDTGLALARARVMGGCSAINACVWLRGSAADFDEWAELGNSGWAFSDMLPYFQRAECDPDGSDLRGSTGSVPVFRADAKSLNRIDQATIQAANLLGIPYTDDLNRYAIQHPAIGPAPKNVANATRMNGAFTYLARGRGRSNLTILSETMVDSVLVDAGNTSGVRTAAGTTFHAPSVVLCAGAYNSPAILLRSGIGPSAHLEDVGIPLVADLPGVGTHLLDHPLLSTFRTDMFWPIRKTAQPPAKSFITVLTKARSQRADDEIDLHLYSGQAQNPDTEDWRFTITISLMQSFSQGSVRLASKNPAVPPLIDHAYFSTPSDLDALCDGFDLALQLSDAEPLREVLVPGAGFSPGWANGDRNALKQWAREHVSTTWHPSSTCRMGPLSDELAVVDQAGCVYGLNGLRVADASIFPTGPRANLHWTVIAVAEKVAESMLSSGER